MGAEVGEPQPGRVLGARVEPLAAEGRRGVAGQRGVQKAVWQSVFRGCPPREQVELPLGRDDALRGFSKFTSRRIPPGHGLQHHGGFARELGVAVRVARERARLREHGRLEPAERAILPPCPGFSSTLCTIVPVLRTVTAVSTPPVQEARFGKAMLVSTISKPEESTVAASGMLAPRSNVAPVVGAVRLTDGAWFTGLATAALVVVAAFLALPLVAIFLEVGPAMLVSSA